MLHSNLILDLTTCTKKPKESIFKEMVGFLCLVIFLLILLVILVGVAIRTCQVFNSSDRNAKYIDMRNQMPNIRHGVRQSYHTLRKYI